MAVGGGEREDARHAEAANPFLDAVFAVPMVDLPPALLLAGGIVLLIAGAEALVRGASRLALAAGLSRLVVGLVVVALGTSAPEVAVSVGAALEGRGELALGNVVGSNTFNVLFILGASALVAPLMVRARLVRVDVPIMFGMSGLLVLLALDGALGILDAALLVALGVGYIGLNLRLGRRERVQEAEADAPGVDARGGRALAGAVAFTLVGLAGLVAGARLAVDGATDLARALGVSDLVVGLTVVAAGTSLPEVATSVLAAARGERDIAVGNIVGSNVLNVALILGLSAGVAPGGIPVGLGVLTFDLPVMVAAALAVLPVAFTGQVIARWEGAVFLLYYVGYVAHLALTATEHPTADELAFAFLWFVLPLTLITLGAAVAREARHRLKSARAA